MNNTTVIFIVPFLAGIIMPVLVAQTVQAKFNSIFSAIGSPGQSFQYIVEGNLNNFPRGDRTTALQWC